MTAYNAITGISTMHLTAFLATDAIRIGEPQEKAETIRVEWIPLADIPKLAAAGQLTEGPSLTALNYYLAIYRSPAP